MKQHVFETLDILLAMAEFHQDITTQQCDVALGRN